MTNTAKARGLATREPVDTLPTHGGTTSEHPDLKLFRETTRRLLSESASGAALRSLHASDVAFDRTWWARGADLGWSALLAPEECGGGSITGSEVVDLAVLAQEWGRHAAPGPLLAVSTVVAGLAASGATEAHRPTLEAIVAGRLVATWAYSGDGVPGVVTPACTATTTDTGYLIDGVAERVEAAPQADVLLITVSVGDDVMQMLVPAATSGVSVTRARSIDLVRQYGTVRLDGVHVPVTARVGDPATTSHALERQWQIAVLLRCAETVGAITRAFELTRQWAFDRYSFGRPLASYQALKHRYADMYMRLQACEAIMNAAARAVQERRAEARMLLSAAKSYIGEHGLALLHDCIQLHGGIGVTWEHDLHLWVRRTALNSNTFGTSEDHQLWLAGQAERGRAR